MFESVTVTFPTMLLTPETLIIEGYGAALVLSRMAMPAVFENVTVLGKANGKVTRPRLVEPSKSWRVAMTVPPLVPLAVNGNGRPAEAPPGLRMPNDCVVAFGMGVTPLVASRTAVRPKLLTLPLFRNRRTFVTVSPLSIAPLGGRKLS